jgi:hypothetical protein
MSRNRNNTSDSAETTPNVVVLEKADKPETPDTTDKAVASAASAESVTPDTTAKVDVSTLSVSNPDQVRETYASADKGGKAAIRTFVTKAMLAAIDAKDMDAATAAKDLNESLVTVRDTSGNAPDYAQIVAERIVSLRIAARRLESGDVPNLPEGVVLDIDDLFAKVGKLDELVKTGESDISGEGFMKVAWGTKAPKRDVGAHLREWANSVEIGRFATIATVAAFRSEEYGSDNPSNGAVAAHLFGNGEKAHDGSKYDKSDLSHVVPVAATATSVRGVRRVK